MSFQASPTVSLKSHEMGVQTLYTEEDVVGDLWAKKLSGMSLRRIASEYPGITFADIQRCLKGEFPKSPHKRMALGLTAETVTTITVMLEGEIPAGTQVLTAVRCPCGRWFSSNHPARQRCFICRPYRGRKHHD